VTGDLERGFREAPVFQCTDEAAQEGTCPEGDDPIVGFMFNYFFNLLAEAHLGLGTSDL